MHLHSQTHVVANKHEPPPKKHPRIHTHIQSGVSCQHSKVLIINIWEEKKENKEVNKEKTVKIVQTFCVFT